MPSADFQRRARELAAGPAPAPVARPVHPEVPERVREPAASARPPREATTRRERLQLALAAMARGGITGNLAYSPAFRWLAKLGVIVKPLHFWALPELVLFGFALTTTLMGGTALIAMALGEIPRPIAAMIDAGPIFFVSLNLVLAGVFAGVHWVQARRAGLPRWRDL